MHHPLYYIITKMISENKPANFSTRAAIRETSRSDARHTGAPEPRNPASAPRGTDTPIPQFQNLGAQPQHPKGAEAGRCSGEGGGFPAKISGNKIQNKQKSGIKNIRQQKYGNTNKQQSIRQLRIPARMGRRRRREIPTGRTRRGTRS